jgi:hypothetical protein
MSTTVRANPYTGPSRLAVPFPSDEGEHDEAEAVTTPEDAPTVVDEGGQGGAGDTPRRRPSATRKIARRIAHLPTGDPLRLPSGVKRRARGDAAGLVLAGLAWVWVVRPYLQGGPGEVADVLRAKFFNKGPDGEAL